MYDLSAIRTSSISCHNKAGLNWCPTFYYPTMAHRLPPRQRNGKTSVSFVGLYLQFPTKVTFSKLTLWANSADDLDFFLIFFPENRIRISSKLCLHWRQLHGMQILFSSTIRENISKCRLVKSVKES